MPRLVIVDTNAIVAALLACEKLAILITGDLLLLKNAPERRQLVGPSDHD